MNQKPKQIISLGAGVQSSTMALMAAKGLFSTMPDMAIFADTMSEPESVYRWLDWLETQLPFPIIKVSAGSLEKEALKVRISQKSNEAYLRQDIPAFTVDSQQEKGQMWRQCTARFKIEPIQKFAKQFKSESVVMWLGISTDEAHRMKPSTKKWIENIFPLIDKNLSRNDCLDWMERENLPQPPRSSCVFCPYHSDREWLRLKTQEPTEFSRAVEFEKKLQQSMAQVERLKTIPFLHSSRQSLETVVFKDEYQPNFFGNECEGMCGV